MVSYVALEGPSHGRGYYVHQGKGVGHDRKAADAMSDGEYTLIIDGVDVDNDTAVDQTSAPETLADGSTLFTEVRLGRISIGEAPEGGSDGDALRLETYSDNGRLRFTTLFDADNRIQLGDLDRLSFDFNVDESTTTIHAPVIRLIVDGDGDLATTADRGELVFEWAYQGLGDVPQDSWQSVDLAGDDWVAWQRANGQNFDQVANMTTLSDWSDADGFTPAGGVTFDEDSTVLGWSIAYGSGNGTGVIYVDDLQVGGVKYDFGSDSFF